MCKLFFLSLLFLFIFLGNEVYGVKLSASSQLSFFSPSSFLIHFFQVSLRARNLGNTLCPLRFMRIGSQEEEGNISRIPSESSDDWTSLVSVREHTFINAPMTRNVSIRA